MIDNQTRAIAEMIDGVNKMAGVPMDALADIAEHAAGRAGLHPETVAEALRYLRTQQDRV